ncbi:5' exonuclease Apollo-like [Hippocampus comes]|uniref:5' exonuclease Apollo-like n=1 Tax=Hippocampus comes TaxID=109280 RepID=UPI00094F1B00|nr:PREDICTED: 5' exonuclease Apollo-like [Hippocampus comes]
MEFQTWIEVSFDRMETLRVLGLPDVFTTDPGAGRIRVVEQREISFAAMCRWNSEEPTLAIYPTSRPLPLFHPKLHVVPYSDHSSYQELVDFVSGLKPSSLLPIVGNGIPASLSTLLPYKRREVLVPESVQRYMRRLPENWSRSSVKLRRQYVRPNVPKGVVFESPGERPGPGSSSSEDDAMDMDSDCSLAESREEFTFYKSSREPLDTWRLNLVHPIPEEILMAQRVPFSQLSQSNFTPLEILQDAGGGLTPRRRATEEATASASHGTPARPPSSDDDDSSVSEGGSVALDGFNDFVALSGSFRFSEAHLEQLENDILKQAVFPPEDLKPCCPLKSVMRMVSLCPVRKPDVP